RTGHRDRHIRRQHRRPRLCRASAATHLRRRLAAAAAAMPAYLVCFDLLASQGIDRRGLPLAERRALLEDVLAGLPAPITLCPHTISGTEAERWLDTLPDAGIEGVMIKDRAS